MEDNAKAAIDHQGLEVLTPDECWSLIGEQPVGRVAFVEAGEPVILPVNHAVAGHRIVFRTARGMLLHEALMDRPVAFEVDGFDAGARTGWSVLVQGRAGLAEDTDDLADLDELGLDPWADAVDRDDWVTIIADSVSGRRITRG